MKPQKRSRLSAKKAGTTFETLIAQYLNKWVDDRIERRRQTGNKDRGDISGLKHLGARIVVECKNTAKLSLGTWANEVAIERGNDDAQVGVVVHKRHGVAAAGRQWVTMEVDDLVALLTGVRPQEEADQ